jgi:hypothetical protein
MTLAVAARSRTASPATSLGLRLCGVDPGESPDDFDAEAPTCPGFDPETLAELDKTVTVDSGGEQAAGEEVPRAGSDQHA